ncbi:MAG: SDR family NAD(P)-dependent oxidoreductase, partial [Myxococcota bacterium]
MAKPLMCAPELLSKDLSGRRYVVTGANSGIGLETAKQLMRQGATVVFGCRRTNEADEAIVAFTAAESPRGESEVYRLDLADLASVRTFAATVVEAKDALHGLVNNAGVMNTPQGATKDGFEMQLGVNHIGHFLLTQELENALERAAPSRVVNVSSCYHDKAMGRPGDVDLNDPFFESREYDGWAAYAQSKLANL